MTKLELVRKHLDLYSAGDWDAYRAMLGRDAIYEEVPTRTVAQGPDKFLTAVKRWKEAFPDLSATWIDGYEVGDKVFVEVEWMGTHEGPLAGPFGPLAPTHKRGTMRAALVFRVVDDKVVEDRHYFDLLTVLMQIGISPAVPAPVVTKLQPEAPKHRH